MLLKLGLLSALTEAVVQVDFEISNAAKSSQVNPLSFSKRSLSNETIEPFINASLTTGYNFYHGSINVGSPPQEIEVLLDTGSPVSWVYGPEGSYHNATKFNSNQSSTFKKGNYSFSAEYGSGIYLGSWGTDLVSAPEFVGSEPKEISKLNKSDRVPFEFGIISSFSTAAGAPGLLGLGPHIDNAGPKGYLSLPEAYAKYNVTSSSAFSIFLEDKKGRFLFDGVDLRYVQLPLYRFHEKKIAPVSPSSASQSSSWQIFLDTATLNNGADYLIRESVTLDTGSPVSLLPPAFVDAVGNSLGLTKYGKYETYYVNNTINSTLPTGVLSFNFNGFKVQADISEFLIPGEYVWMDDGPSNVTALALMGSNNCLLGDSFFRSVYTILEPATGDVILGHRTKLSLNATTYSNSSNTSSVVSFSHLLKNGSVIVNASAVINPTGPQASLSSSPGEGGGVKSLPPVLAANRYVGTVPADKAASVIKAAASTSSASTSSVSTSSLASTSSSAQTSKSSGSKSSSSASASSTSSSKTNSGNTYVMCSRYLYLLIACFPFL